MIVGNMCVGKGLEILPTLSSLLTELSVLFSVLFCCSFTLTKCACSWLSSKIKFILCSSWMLCSVDWQFFAKYQSMLHNISKEWRSQLQQGKTLKYCKNKIWLYMKQIVHFLW